ncbi:hypothetical protein MJD09_01855 [bacterium]|nr:hypothetical protein [bacterium]
MSKTEDTPSPEMNEDSALRTILEGTAGETGEPFFRALVKNFNRTLNTKGAWVTEYIEETGRRLKNFYGVGENQTLTNPWSLIRTNRRFFLVKTREATQSNTPLQL